MKIIVRAVHASGLAALLGCIPGARAEYFANGYYYPLSGKVGERLVSDAVFNVEDLPEQCVIAWTGIAVSGALPPGIDGPGAGIPQTGGAASRRVLPTAFSGTPLAAGDYPVRVMFRGLGCENGRSFGDREIEVNFHITP